MSLIKTIETRFSSVSLNVLNLYQPSDPKFQTYREVISNWNSLLQSNSTNIGYIYAVFDTYNLLTGPEDFIYSIEPSIVGSKKIADLIYITTLSQ